MYLNLRQSLVVLTLAALSGVVGAAQNQIAQLETYRQQGVSQFDAEKGRELWYSSVDQRSCSSCHGDDPRDTGKHVKTGKTILPMALSVNSDGYQSAKKIEKWFLRNCKWTFSRECSLQEKADILAWLSSQ